MTAPNGPPGHLPLRAVYSVAELAHASGVSIYLMRRILKGSGVRIMQPARLLLVPLCEVHRKLPELWESILLCETARKGI